MGLSARVYTNIESLKERLRPNSFLVDQATGEVYPRDDDETLSVNRGDLIAISKRLGNVTEVAALNAAISHLFAGHDSILLNKVLYSGSHSGDHVDIADFPRLREELSLLAKSRLSEDPYVPTFLSKMQDLLDTAEHERNPIVFT
jgi:hypothetical protein